VEQAFARKDVLITGASSGIGAETAKLFARAGASVAMAARSQANLDSVRAEILKETPSAKLFVASVDVRDTKSVAEFVRGAAERFGHIDTVVPNAGAVTPLTQLLADKDADAFWNTFEVNIKGVYNIIRSVYSIYLHRRLLNQHCGILQSVDAIFVEDGRAHHRCRVECRTTAHQTLLGLLHEQVCAPTSHRIRGLRVPEH